jgi:hypothetical protein
MGELVSDDLGLRASGRRRGMLGVEQEQDVFEHDEPRILHRPGGEVGDGHEIELGVGVAHVEVLAELVDEGRSDVERQTGEGRSALGRDHPDGKRLLATLGDVEVPYRQRHQVAREWGGRGERVKAHPFGVRAAGARLLGRVGDGKHSRWRRDRHFVGGLESRLVEAREGPPGVRRFELRVGVPAPLLLDPIEAGKVGREGRVIGDLDDRRPRGQWPGEGEHELFGGDAATGESRRRRGLGLHAATRRHGARYGHVARVQDDEIGGLREVDLDRRHPGKARLGGIDSQGDAIPPRNRCGR